MEEENTPLSSKDRSIGSVKRMRYSKTSLSNAVIRVIQGEKLGVVANSSGIPYRTLSGHVQIARQTQQTTSYEYIANRRGPKPKIPAHIEEYLSEWISKRINTNEPIYRELIVHKANELYQKSGGKGGVGSGWCRRFFKRHQHILDEQKIPRKKRDPSTLFKKRETLPPEKLVTSTTESLEKTSYLSIEKEIEDVKVNLKLQEKLVIDEKAEYDNLQLQLTNRAHLQDIWNNLSKEVREAHKNLSQYVSFVIKRSNAMDDRLNTIHSRIKFLQEYLNMLTTRLNKNDPIMNLPNKQNDEDDEDSSRSSTNETNLSDNSSACPQSTLKSHIV